MGYCKALPIHHCVVYGLFYCGDEQQEYYEAPVASHTSSEGTILSHKDTKAQRSIFIYQFLHWPVCSVASWMIVLQEGYAAVGITASRVIDMARLLSVNLCV